MKVKRALQITGIILLVILGCIISLFLFGSVAQAAGLVDDTINADNLYSKYALDNYQLDFYVDNSWNWLPWNWKKGIGNTVMYGFYALANMLWILNLKISSATGYVVQEAYQLDFIKDLSSAIGGNIQKLAGVDTAGFHADGFYLRMLPMIILVVGLYAAYSGLVKHETSKAIQAILNFVVVFVISSAFIAYAPQYIDMVNGFSSDLSVSALDVGTKLVLPDSDTKGKDSVDLIRDSLFMIQVHQPWLILQYGTSDVSAIGEERIEGLLSVSPDNGEDREKVVETEVTQYKNSNMSVPKVGSRLGTVMFLLLLNLGISFFVFMLTGIMLLSQILFIIFAMFLPISFLLSMLPNQEAKWKQAITKLFNTIMTRVGITFIVTIAFSISSMLYNLSDGYPFFMIAFLQIVTFAGIYIKINDLLGIFSVQSNDSQNVGRQMVRRPYMLLRRNARKMQRNVKRALKKGTSGRGGTTEREKDKKERKNRYENQGSSDTTTRTNVNNEDRQKNSANEGVHDTSNRQRTNMSHSQTKTDDSADMRTGSKSSVNHEDIGRQNRNGQKMESGSNDESRQRESGNRRGTVNKSTRQERNNQSDEGRGYHGNEKEHAGNKTKNVPKRENVRTKKPATNKKRVESSDQDILDFYAAHGMHRPDDRKEPKRKKLFEKQDFNEDVTEYKKNLKNRMQAKETSRPEIRPADKTPTVRGMSIKNSRKETLQDGRQSIRQNERQRR